MDMIWLPPAEDFTAHLRSAKALPAADQVAVLRELSLQRLDFLQTTQLDNALLKATRAYGAPLPGLEPLRLAVLGSATTGHLPPGIRVAGLRRGFAIEVYEAPYGMYWQELMDATTRLHAFQPHAVLLAVDARHVASSTSATAALDTLRACWQRAQEAFGCQVLQQTVLPIFSPLLGNNEHRLLQSPAALVAEANRLLRFAAEEAGIDLLALDTFAAQDGLAQWYEPALWHKSKHEVHPAAGALYGEHVVRLLAAARGRSAKCLVLDLDNTLWGGVIGDEGLEGIVLGQGSAAGEAFAEFQRYALALTERGIILAVCSKNDEANALAPFRDHPEMQLKRAHIACFTANWSDKATNLREIAKTLNLGLDALVFADDNPVERALIRRELPMVHVPEMPEDPAEYVRTVAAAGYFEATRLSSEDAARTQQYQANAERSRMLESATDMASYLRSLDMVLTARPIEPLDLTRVTQLLNKTNQFNLATERLSEAEVGARARSPEWITLQVRLADRFGDNGLIAVLMARREGRTAIIESWLMSCRVLGREVERASLQLLAEQAREQGVERLIGLYKPTAKNAIVRELYPRLGFTALDSSDAEQRWVLELERFQMRNLPFRIEQPAHV